MAGLTRDQKRHLVERIARINRERYRPIGPEDTTETAAARRLVKKHDRKMQRRNRSYNDRISKDCKNASQLLYFGTPEDALNKVLVLEKKYKITD